MTAANRVQITCVRESTPGTTPTTPRMRKVRYTGESLDLYKPEYDDPDEIRDDRMNDDPTLLFQSNGGALNINVSYPVNGSPLSEFIASAFYNEWTLAPERDNDGTTDSIITDIGTTTDTVACTTGPAFVAGHLVKFSGNSDSANDGVRKCTTGSATAPVFASSGFVADAAPAGASRMKVVGFQGASGDITATATGLGSTALDFTTLGLTVGQTLKIGGTAAGDKFATAALNGYATVAAIAAHALTLANKPVGWATDSGAGKTIKVWFGDVIKNGVKTDANRVALTIEKGYLGQTVPTYIVGRGLTVNSATISLRHKDKVRAVFNFLGMTGAQSTVTLDIAPDAETTAQVMSANVNVGRLSEAGAPLAAPNFCRSLEISINNNLRQIEDVTQSSPAGYNEGDATIETKFETYFGNNSILLKYFNGTPTSHHSVVAKNGQAIAFHVPRQIYRDGTPPQATAKNTDVMLNLTGRASKDTTTSAELLMDRLEYLE